MPGNDVPAAAHVDNAMLFADCESEDRSRCCMPMIDESKRDESSRCRGGQPIRGVRIVDLSYCIYLIYFINLRYSDVPNSVTYLNQTLVFE